MNRSQLGVVINENSKCKTIYRKIWDVSYNKAKRVHEAWIRYKGKDRQARLCESEKRWHITGVHALDDRSERVEE